MKIENTLKSKEVLFILAMSLSLFGCTGAENNSIDLQSDPNEKGELSKYTLIDGSGFKGIKNFDRTERTNLVELPVDPRFNAQVFISHDSSDPIYTGAAFIAPKFFAYGNQQGGAVVLKKHPNGNYTISFSVGFIDGQSPTFFDAKSQNKINVPNAFLIQDWEGLKSNLASSFNIDEKKIGTLAGCPKLISIIYAGREYNVTPSRFLGGNSCELDPFTVSITVSKNDAQDLLYNQLPNGMIDVVAKYEARTAVPISKINIKFSRRKIYHDLLSSIKMNWFSSVDAKVAVTNIVKNQMLEVSIQGTTDENIDDMISKIMNQFFEPFRPDPKAAEASTCSNVLCLQFSSTVQNQNDDLQFDYSHVSNEMVGYSYITSTKLKNVEKNSVTIGQDLSCKSDCGRIVSGGKVVSTSLIIKNGSKIKLKPEFLINHTIIQSLDQKHTDHPTCQLTFLHAAGLSVRECNLIYHIPEGGHGSTICNSCAAGEVNQWNDVTTYENNFYDQKIGNPGVQSLSNLILVFKGWNEKKSAEDTVECSLNAFENINVGDSLTLFLSGGGVCDPFKKLSSPIQLSIVDRSLPQLVFYKEGRLVNDWNGPNRELPIEKVFVPSQELSLTASLFEDDPYQINP